MTTTPIPSESGNAITNPHETAHLLNEAKELIIAGKRQEAVDIVSDILDNDEDNVEALWLYINLTPDREEVLPLLEELLSLQPDHIKAQTMLNELRGNPTPRKRIRTSRTQREKFATTTANEASVSEQQYQPDSQTILMQQMLLQQQMMLENQSKNFGSQPAINITNVNKNTATAHAYASAGAINHHAYSVGKFFAKWLCIFGVAHLMNGKPVSGIFTMLLGLFWLPFLLAGIATILGAFIVIPLHLSFARNNALSGARLF